MNIKKILNFLILFLILITVLTTVSNAASDPSSYTDPNQFDRYPSAATSSNTSWGIVDRGINVTLGVALSIIRTVAFCFALLMLLVIGIKYVIASPQKKAELKHDVPTYLVGVFLLFGAAGILQLITYFVGDTMQP